MSYEQDPISSYPYLFGRFLGPDTGGPDDCLLLLVAASALGHRFLVDLSSPNIYYVSLRLWDVS